MGFTPWPYDFTSEAVENTYHNINEHGDIIAHHFDEGIPWPEAFAGNPFHKNVLENIDNRVRRLTNKQKVYLAVTPLEGDRKKLASYWGKSDHLSRPGKWKHKKFDDPEIVAAYINFCRYMIKRFKPEYMCYAIEANYGWSSEKDPEFISFVHLLEETYKILKKEYPDMPLFVSLQTNNEYADGKAFEKINKILLTVSDYVAVSSYPYMGKGNHSCRGDPDKLSRDLFRKMAVLSPEKPFAVAETGYIAEKLTVWMFFLPISIRGSARWQADYLRYLFKESNRLNAEFVIWFVSQDYDEGWKKMKKIGVPDFFKAWRDTGLLNGQGNPRPSLKIWDSWLSLPKKK